MIYSINLLRAFAVVCSWRILGVKRTILIDTKRLGAIFYVQKLPS